MSSMVSTSGSTATLKVKSPPCFIIMFFVVVVDHITAITLFFWLAWKAVTSQ